MTVQNSNIQRNYAGTTGLIYHTKNTKLIIINSTFVENFSIGRGSVIFAESLNS